MKLIKHFCGDRDIKIRIAERRDRLFRIAYSWCHSRSLSDDLTQETLAKALKKRASLQNPEALDCWLYGILANCWRDHFRQAREHHDIDDYDFTLDITPESQYERHNVSHTIIKAVSELPIGQRQTVTLVDLEGFSYAEVAGILDIPIGTVMSRLCRARQSLAKKLLYFKSESRNDKTPFIRRVK